MLDTQLDRFLLVDDPDGLVNIPQTVFNPDAPATIPTLGVKEAADLFRGIENEALDTDLIAGLVADGATVQQSQSVRPCGWCGHWHGDECER